MADDVKAVSAAPAKPAIDLQKDVSWLGARLREKSTYAGVTVVVALLLPWLAKFDPALASAHADAIVNAISMIGIGLGGLIAIVTPEAKKVAAVLLAIGIAAALAMPTPASAAGRFKFKLPIPLPVSRPAAAEPAAPPAAPAKTVDPLTWLRQFSVDDLTAAQKDAQANNNTVTLPCWTFLLSLVNAPAATSLLPTTPGVATAIQKLFDDEALLANWFVPNGTFDQANVACAPMVNKIQVQVTVGGAAIATALLGGPGASAALLTGLKTILSGVTALPVMIP